MQLNLRHIIRKDILIYPGYVPEPGINYRVFHYGLKFSVGNWSFDKADWRNTDVVNTCWAKFPEPPNASSLSSEDEDILKRDKLSIECAETLNKALVLHYKRRNCPTSNVIGNQKPAIVSNEISLKTDGVLPNIRTPAHGDTSNSSSQPESNNGNTRIRIWMVGLWAVSVIGFLAVMSMILSNRKGDGSRVKANNRYKKAYVGPSDNATSCQLHNKHLLEAEMASEA